MSNSKPAPTGYGSLMNFTSLPQRFPGLLVDKGYIGEEELKELGLYEEREFNGVNRFYAGFARIFENEGLLEDADEILEDKGFRNAVQKTVLRAGLRKELNEGYGGKVGRNRDDSLTEYLVNSGLVSKDSHLDNYTEFFKEEGVLPEEYDEESARDTISKVVTKAMLDADKRRTEIEDDYLRPKAKYVWEIMRDEMEVKPVPVQIPGERGYWAEPVSKDGVMLGAVKSDEKMTVMAFPGLEEEFYQKLIADENKESDLYESREVEVEVPEELEAHLDTEEVPERTRYLLMNPDNPQVNKDSGKPINGHYHELIRETAEMLSEIYGEEVGEWVVERYEEETEVNPVLDREEWVKGPSQDIGGQQGFQKMMEKHWD